MQIQIKNNTYRVRDVDTNAVQGLALLWSTLPPLTLREGETEENLKLRKMEWFHEGIQAFDPEVVYPFANFVLRPVGNSDPFSTIMRDISVLSAEEQTLINNATHFFMQTWETDAPALLGTKNDLPKSQKKKTPRARAHRATK